MNISDIEVILLKCPVPDPPPRTTASFVFDGSIYVKVYTDEGIVGIGEPSAYGGPLLEVKRIIETQIKPHLVGKNPFDVDTLTTQNEFPGGQGYGNVLHNCAIAGIGHALWDIVGKALDIPLYRLLNKEDGHRDRVRAYASGGMSFENEDIEPVIEEAIKCQEEGYAAWKMRPSTPTQTSHLQRQKAPPTIDIHRFLSLAEKIREAVGPNMDLLVDAGCRCKNLRQAINISRELERLDFHLFEEPLARVCEDYAALAREVELPIAGGECLVNRQQFLPWIERNAYDIIQPDGNLAGITEVMHIAHIAASRNIPCVIHNWANAVSIAANVHLAAAIPSCPMVEFAVTYNPLRTELVKEPLVPKEGFFVIPERPGLGVELDEKVVAKYRFDR